MALQPLPGIGLPHKTPPFIPICSFTPPVPFPCNQVVGYLSVPSEASLRFSEHRFFFGVGSYPHAQPPTSRTSVSLFVWAITFDLLGLGDPASSYATAGLALRIIWPHKPHHYVKAEIPAGGNNSTVIRQSAI